MRILVVNSFFPPRTTGSAHFSLDVAREYVRQGHEVLVLTTRVPDAPTDEVMDGFRVVRVPAVSITPGTLAFNYALPFAVRLGAVRRIRKLFDDFRPDVVHQNGQFFDLTFLTTWVAWRRKIPRVLTVHTPLMHTNRALHALIATVDRLVLRPLNAIGRPAVVGVDRYVCEMVQRRYRPGWGTVRFVPATLRVNEFARGDGESVRARWQLGTDPVVLSFGHVIPIRSRVPLINALPKIIVEFPNLKLLVVGEVYYDEFRRVAERLGVSNHVISVGRIPHVDVPDYLAAADVESHDLDGHGLGITTMEVMAARVPIFARVRRDVFPGIDLDEWPELQIVDSAEPDAIAESICHLLRSAEFRAEVVERQFEFVCRYFAADVVAAQYLQLFADRVAHPSSRP
jgi:glycosyltransferase involved in cell wall biosynthesis